jgi:hypothetical protein
MEQPKEAIKNVVSQLFTRFPGSASAASNERASGDAGAGR